MASGRLGASDVAAGTYTTVYTCPSATTSTIIGLYLCNQSGGQIEGTAQFFDSGTSTHVSLTHGTPIPSGTTIVAVGGDGKVVLEAGDIFNIPTGMFRGFENAGDDEGLIFVVLGGDDPGIITWVPSVLELSLIHISEPTRHL